MGIRDKPIAPASPWQNGFAERLIGSIWRECVVHIIVFSEAHLRRILTKYAAYYNELTTMFSWGGIVTQMLIDRRHRGGASYSARRRGHPRSARN